MCDTISVTLDDVGNDVGDQVNSYSQPHDDPPTSWTISMHPQQLDEYHLLHEVAHCITPRWRFGGPTEGSAVPAHVERSFHGPHFASVRLMLAEQFASAAQAADLREALDHFKIATVPWADVLAAVEKTHRTEADLDQVRQRALAGTRSRERSSAK